MEKKDRQTEMEVLQKDLKKSRLECQRLNEQMTLIISQQFQTNKLLEEITAELQTLEKFTEINSLKKEISRLLRKIYFDETQKESLDFFSFYFDQANQDFIRRISEKHPSLTFKDHKLCVYLRLNMSTKDIAPLLNISVRGVEISRYRLRKKLNLDKNQNLSEFLSEI